MEKIKPISHGAFGPVYDQFENRPADAIRFLMKIKNGECLKVFKRDDIGQIDICWGKNNSKTNEGYGLKHIIEKHGDEFKYAGVDIAEFLEKIIEKGEVIPEPVEDPERVLLQFEFFRGIVALSWFKKEKRLIITAFFHEKSAKIVALDDRKPGGEVPVLSPFEQDKDTTKNPDSDTVNKKNNSEELGAVEVIEQNTYSDVSGLKPTYKLLSSYDHLFGSAGTDFPPVKGDITETLRQITDVINKYNFQAAAIAAHLKADTLKQSAFNIWHFCTSNIAYKLDKTGYEQLRTPNRVWKDRHTGVDCDCFAILSSCILLQMGYKPKLAVVAFNNNSQFGHIYSVVGSSLQNKPYNLGDHNGGAISGGIVIDPVMRTIFNKHPKGITKAKIMNIEVLNGIDNCIQGLGAIMPADATTQKLIDHQEKLIAVNKTGQKSLNNYKEIRKLQFMILMNGHPDRNHYLEIMPLVDDIDKNGEFVFISEEAANEAVKFLDATVGKRLTSFEIVYEDGKPVPVFNGLGASDIEELGKLKDVFKKVKDKVKETVKKVGDKIAKGVKAGVKAIVRYNPATILMRNGFLAAISLNFRNLAKRLYIGLMTPAELQTAGYTSADQVKAKGVITKAENFFEKVGGKKENLIATIKSGKNKKALFGSPAPAKTASKSGSGSRLSGYDDIQSIGDPITLSAITVAMAPILQLVKWLKESGISFKKAEEDTTSPSEDIISPELQDEYNKALLNPESENIDNANQNQNDDEKKDNTLLYVGGGLGLMALIYAMTRKKS